MKLFFYFCLTTSQLWNHWTHRIGSPIKICGIFIRGQWNWSWYYRETRNGSKQTDILTSTFSISYWHVGAMDMMKGFVSSIDKINHRASSVQCISALTQNEISKLSSRFFFVPPDRLKISWIRKKSWFTEFVYISNLPTDWLDKNGSSWIHHAKDQRSMD